MSSAVVQGIKTYLGSLDSVINLSENLLVVATWPYNAKTISKSLKTILIQPFSSLTMILTEAISSCMFLGALAAVTKIMKNPKFCNSVTNATEYAIMKTQIFH